MGLRKGEAGITKGGGLLKNVVVVDVGGCGSAEEGLTLKKDTSDRDATKKWGGGQQLRKLVIENWLRAIRLEICAMFPRGHANITYDSRVVF